MFLSKSLQESRLVYSPIFKQLLLFRGTVYHKIRIRYFPLTCSAINPLQFSFWNVFIWDSEHHKPSSFIVLERKQTDISTSPNRNNHNGLIALQARGNIFNRKSYKIFDLSVNCPFNISIIMKLWEGFWSEGLIESSLTFFFSTTD